MRLVRNRVDCIFLGRPLTVLLFGLFAQPARNLPCWAFSGLLRGDDPEVLRNPGHRPALLTCAWALLLMLAGGVACWRWPKLRLARFRAFRWFSTRLSGPGHCGAGLLYIIDFWSLRTYLGVTPERHRAGALPVMRKHRRACSGKPPGDLITAGLVCRCGAVLYAPVASGTRRWIAPQCVHVALLPGR